MEGAPREEGKYEPISVDPAVEARIDRNFPSRQIKEDHLANAMINAIEERNAEGGMAGPRSKNLAAGEAVNDNDRLEDGEASATA